jgi:triacylglycerol lipase
MLAQGWDVVTSDYEGAKSELLVPKLEGLMTLDGIRAAEHLRAAGLPGKATEVGLLGYSGGSVPSVSAGRLAPTYAPDIRLVAVTAGGVDAEPLYVLAHIDGSILFGGVTLGLIGINRAYPKLDAFSLFKPAGLAIAKRDAVDGYGCAGGVAAQVQGTAAKYTKYPTSQALAAVPRVEDILAKLSLAKGRAPTAPSFIYNTVHDEIMRIQQVDALVHHWCAARDKVYYDRSSVGEHISGIAVYNQLALRYLRSRFARHPAPSTCVSGPHDPKQ